MNTRAAVGPGRLTWLNTVQLKWCCVGRRSLLPLMQDINSSSSSSSSMSLTHLNLRRCEVSDPGAAHLQTLLASPTCSLKTLAMINCHMSSAAVKSVAQGLGANSSLTSLRFSGNNGGKHAALAFATALRNNVTLQHLNLSFNKLCPSGGEALAAALSANARLAASAAVSGSNGGSNGGSSAGLRRLVVQRKEIGGTGLRAVITALRGVTGYTGGLTLRVLQAPGGREGVQGLADNMRVLQIVELPVLFVCHENQEMLISEEWLSQLLDKQQQQQQQQDGDQQQGGDLIAAGAAVESGSSSSSSSSSGGISVTSSPARSSSDGRPSSSGSYSGGASSSSSSSSSTSDHAVIEMEVFEASIQQQQQQSPQGSPSAPTVPKSSSSNSSSSRSKPPRQPGRISSFAAAAATAAAVGGVQTPFKTSLGRGLATAGSSSSSSSSLEPSASGMTDGLTPACSMAEISSLPSAASTAALISSSSSDGCGSNGSSSSRRCPQLIFLSQNDPGDNVAAVLRSVEGVACVDLAGLQLSAKGVKSLAAAIPEAKSLKQLILRSTDLLDEGASALAAALQQQQEQPLTSPTSATTASSSSNSPVVATVLVAGGGNADSPNSSSSSSSDEGHSLEVLDLSQNIICDTGAGEIAAAVEAGRLPHLRQLAVVDNRYPFDWSTVLQLQGLQVLQPGLRVDLGAPSSWCVAPSAVKGRLVNHVGGLVNTPAGWTPVTDVVDGSGGEVVVAGCSSSMDALSISSEDLCGVCFDAPNALYVQECKHQLCIECYKQLVKAAASSSRRHQQGAEGAAAGCAACPFCRAPMSGFRYSAWVQEEERCEGVVPSGLF